MKKLLALIVLSTVSLSAESLPFNLVEDVNARITVGRNRNRTCCERKRKHHGCQCRQLEFGTFSLSSPIEEPGFLVEAGDPAPLNVDQGHTPGIELIFTDEGYNFVAINTPGVYKVEFQVSGFPQGEDNLTAHFGIGIVDLYEFQGGEIPFNLTQVFSSTKSEKHAYLYAAQQITITEPTGVAIVNADAEGKAFLFGGKHPQSTVALLSVAQLTNNPDSSQ